MVGTLIFFIVVGHTHLARPFDSRINFDNRTRNAKMASFLIQIFCRQKRPIDSPEKLVEVKI